MGLRQLLVDFGNAYPAIKNPDFQNKDKKTSQLKAAKNLYNYLKKKKNSGKIYVKSPFSGDQNLQQWQTALP